MLKIKDSVDLKELEKFGFIFEYGFYEKKFSCLTYFIGTLEHRIISVKTFDDKECVLDTTLFDLIQAGYVEKVGDE